MASVVYLRLHNNLSFISPSSDTVCGKVCQAARLPNSFCRTSVYDYYRTTLNHGRRCEEEGYGQVIQIKEEEDLFQKESRGRDVCPLAEWRAQTLLSFLYPCSELVVDETPWETVANETETTQAAKPNKKALHVGEYEYVYR